MATTPSQKPVASELPQDLKFNAGKIDEFVTSLAQWYIDRFGGKHYTIEGLKQLVLQQIYDLGWNPVGTFQGGATVANPGDIVQDTSTGAWYRWDNLATLPKTVPAGSTPGSAGGTGEGKWQLVDVSDVLRKDLAKSTGANLVGIKKLGLQNNVPTTVGAFYQTTHINAVTDYGMNPDFDPTTGVANGTNNKTLIRNMLSDLSTIGGHKVVDIPPGNYYFDVSGDHEENGVNLLFGNMSNVTFNCYGATFYQGNSGRFISMQNSKDINLFGLKVVGYSGGTIGFSRSNDCCLNVTYSCVRVNIKHCYLTNSLGDCIYIGGSLVNGGEVGYGQYDIHIKDNTLVERYGNGIRSYENTGNGTRSRLAIAAIDVNGLVITGNLIYGRIDLEPNLSGQKMQYIDIKLNQFRSGSVGAAPSIFEEEPMYVSGGHTMVQGVLCQGPINTVNINNVFIENNSFEYGCIRVAWVPSSVKNNSFLRGLVIVGSTSGPNYSEKIEIIDNIAKAPFDGQDDDELTLEPSTPTTVPQTFIWMQGRVAVCRFMRNSLGSAFGYVIYADPGNSSITDGGRSYVVDNVIDNAAGAVFSKPFALSTTFNGNINMSTMNSGIPLSTINSTTEIAIPVSVPVSGTSVTVSWSNYRGSNWYLTVSAAVSIAGITAAPAFGTRVQIRGNDANSTNTVTLIHSAGFYLKGLANAVLNDNRKTVVLEYIALNTWTEVGRNF